MQHRLVAEFPDVFGPEQKCAVVAALKADFERLKFRYTIVVHTPDHTNDGRNEHLHAIWYEGPCERTADGKWSFDRSVGRGVKFRPGEIARVLRDPVVPCPDTTNPRDLAAADVMVLRSRFARYCSHELEGLGSLRRLDPRRYEDMGIDQEASEHLGTDAARLVAAGVSVDIDYANAMKTWQARLRTLEAELEQSRQTVAGVIAEAVELTYPHVDTDALQAASDASIDARRALELVDLYDEMARSAALRLKRNVEGVLVGIESKKGVRDDLFNERHIRARRDLAIGHLAEIDEAIGNWVEDLGTFRKDVENLEANTRRLSEVVRDEIKKANVTAQRSALRDWASSTILPVKKYPQRPAPHAHFAALKALIESPQARLNVIADGAGHRVDGIGTADEKLLKHPQVANRAKPFLSAVHAKQRLAIYRLHSFIAQHGVDSLSPQKASGRGGVPEAIANMLAIYSDHPEYLAGVAASDEEYHRHHPAPGPVQVPTPVTGSAPAVGAEPADLRTVQSAPAVPAVISVPSGGAAATGTAGSGSQREELSVIDTSASMPPEDGRGDVPAVGDPASKPTPTPLYVPGEAIQPATKQEGGSARSVDVDSASTITIPPKSMVESNDTGRSPYDGRPVKLSQIDIAGKTAVRNKRAQAITNAPATDDSKDILENTPPSSAGHEQPPSRQSPSRSFEDILRDTLAQRPRKINATGSRLGPLEDEGKPQRGRDHGGKAPEHPIARDEDWVMKAVAAFEKSSTFASATSEDRVWFSAKVRTILIYLKNGKLVGRIDDGHLVYQAGSDTIAADMRAFAGHNLGWSLLLEVASTYGNHMTVREGEGWIAVSRPPATSDQNVQPPGRSVGREPTR